MISDKSISVVILCGGQSTRMGKDKALIDYHGLPQYQHISRMVLPITSQVIYSINASQIYTFCNLPHIIDQYQVHGPLNGLLSAFDALPDTHIILIGIDYPLLTLQDIVLLIDRKRDYDDAVCYYHEEDHIAEPLVALYDARCAQLIKSYMQEAARPSIQGFLKTVSVHKINLEKPHNIVSFDSE